MLAADKFVSFAAGFRQIAFGILLLEIAGIT